MKDEQPDMSPRAIAKRLDEMRALYDLMKYLARFRPATKHDQPLKVDGD